MAKPTPPVEVVRAEQPLVGLKHVSIFLAQAFEQQSVERSMLPVSANSPQLPASIIAKDADPT